MDLCTEFADSEEFLIDGDSLLRQTIGKEKLGGQRCTLNIDHCTVHCTLQGLGLRDW